MTVGLGELIIIILVVGFVVALAFRTGFTRGRRAARSESEPSDDADKRH